MLVFSTLSGVLSIHGSLCSVSVDLNGKRDLTYTYFEAFFFFIIFLIGLISSTLSHVSSPHFRGTGVDKRVYYTEVDGGVIDFIKLQ